MSGRRARCRRMVRPGHWGVRARVERFSEPALLLLLRERAAHGYELLDELPALTGEARVDMGNLYRLLPPPDADDTIAASAGAGTTATTCSSGSRAISATSSRSSPTSRI